MILGHAILLMCFSCADNFLDVKPSTALVIPSELSDYQAILDNRNVFAGWSSIQIISSDDIHIANEQDIMTTQANVRNAYLWKSDIFEGQSSSDWNAPFQAVFYANVVLEGLGNLDVGVHDSNQWEVIRGTALFFRAFSYYHLSQLFAKPYQESTSESDIGLPLRITSNVNELVERASIKQTYEFMLGDLLEATDLLPDYVPYKTRPSKTAAHILLARLYLLMENFEEALKHADKALSLYSKLIDYNTLDTLSNSPFPVAIPSGNDEVILNWSVGLFSILLSQSTTVNPELYKSYGENDLRRSIFFTPREDRLATFKGNYTGSNQLFGGLSINEVYLIKSESEARVGNLSAALTTLNTLLSSRYKLGAFVPVVAEDKETALGIILKERRKELVMRDVRWSDLRRLNRDTRFQTTLVRTLQDQVYTLKPNDQKYVFPIPDDEIRSSGISQNER